MDLSEIPHEITNTRPEDSLPSLLARLKEVVDRETRIILIKANVYDHCYPVLKAQGYEVSNERIPFPGSGQQAVFREKFQKALKGE
jgi:hypothetical protein